MNKLNSDRNANDEPNMLWQTFAQNNKKKTPKNINDNVWQAIEKHEKQKRRFLVSSICAAASILLFITIGIKQNKQQSYAEKEALLKQAINMCNIEPTPNLNKIVLYEDESIRIYSSTINN